METVELSVSEFSIKYIFFTPKTEIKLKTDEINYGIQRNPPKWPNLFYIPLSRGLDVTLGFTSGGWSRAGRGTYKMLRR